MDITTKLLLHIVANMCFWRKQDAIVEFVCVAGLGGGGGGGGGGRGGGRLQFPQEQKVVPEHTLQFPFSHHPLQHVALPGLHTARDE